MTLEKNKKGKIIVTVLLRSKNKLDKTTIENIKNMRPEEETFSVVKRKLEEIGFEILTQGNFSLTICSTQEHFEKIFNVKLLTKDDLFSSEEQLKRPYYYFKEKISLPKELEESVEKIYISPPIQYFERKNPPCPSYHHLRLSEITKLLYVDHYHLHGINGEGINVVMIDSGFYNHAYYHGKDYNIIVFDILDYPPYFYLTDIKNSKDEMGHGTGIASILLSIAPKVNFVMIKGIESVLAFHLAKLLNAHIITCSWGTQFSAVDEALELEIKDTIADGITVIFAAGNKDKLDMEFGASGHYYICWPGEMSEVISVGGVNIDETFTELKASNYAVSGPSNKYDNRIVPDICGIVGDMCLNEEGYYCEEEYGPGHIMLPITPNCSYDKNKALREYKIPVAPRGMAGGYEYETREKASDGTKEDDGWAVLSGTSSAAPLVAGVTALYLQKRGGLPTPPREVKRKLKEAATDITQGTSGTGYDAESGPDSATGAGFVNVVRTLDDRLEYSKYIIGRKNGGILCLWVWDPQDQWTMFHIGRGFDSDPSGFVLDETLHILIRGRDNSLIEWSFQHQGQWRPHVNISEQVGGQKIDSDPFGFIYKRTPRIIARSQEGNLLYWNLLRWQPWQVINLSEQVEGIKIVGNPSAYISKCSQHIISQSQDRDLLYWYKKPYRDWRVNNLSNQRGGSKIIGNPSGYVLGYNQYVIARSEDNNLIEWSKERRWNGNDLSEDFGDQGKIEGNPSGFIAGSSRFVIARSQDNKLLAWYWESPMRGDPRFHVLSGSQEIRGDPSGFVLGQTPTIVARSPDGALLEWTRNSQGTWDMINLSYITETHSGDSRGYQRLRPLLGDPRGYQLKRLVLSFYL